MHNLFGTDGIRRTLGVTPFTDKELERLSTALAQWIQINFGDSAKIFLGHDTRKSASWIKSTLKARLLRYGITIYDGLICPTPAAAAMLQLHPEFHLALIISASHNLYQDNGLKIIDHRHHKLADIDEQHISQLYFQPSELVPSFDQIGVEHYAPELVQEYIAHVAAHFSGGYLNGLRIVIDCAHGATITTATTLFSMLGAQVITLNAMSTGININFQCGALHPQYLAAQVLQAKADIGFAFDGDGDRIIVVTRNGHTKNGDDILALLLEHPRYKEQQIVVGTIMSNFGLEHYLKSSSRQLMRTAVGDKHVVDCLKKHNLLLGGEQAGHIILDDYLSSSDGVFTALRILETILLTGNWDLETFTKYLQITISVPILNKKDLQCAQITQLIDNAQAQLYAGRILVRYSGTENVLRVMVEDSDLAHAQEICQRLSAHLQNALT